MIKAPEFDKVPDFDKAMNGLWELRSEVRKSLVFVNLDARSLVKEFDLGCSEAALRKWKFADMTCVADWKVDSAFNWKLAGLQPCRPAGPWLT